MTPENQEKFRAAVRGIPTNCLVRAMNRQTPGYDWSQCSKALMADMGPDGLDLDKLVTDARRHYQTILERRDEALKRVLEVESIKKGRP